MKKHMIAAILIALPLVAGCQQRTDFDACVEYWEQNLKGKGQPDMQSFSIGKFKPDRLWAECK